MEREQFLRPMMDFHVQLLNRKTGESNILPLSVQTVGSIPGEITDAQLSLRRMFRKECYNILNAALMDGSISNIAEYFELVYTFIDLSITCEAFGKFVEHSTSFNFGEFSQLRRMMADIDESVDLFDKRKRVVIDYSTYYANYLKRKKEQEIEAYLKTSLKDAFERLFDRYNKLIQKKNRMYVLIAPPLPKNVINPFSSKDRVPLILPEEQPMATMSEVIPNDIEERVTEPTPNEEEQQPVSTTEEVVEEDQKEKFPFEFPNGEKLIEVNLTDGVHYLVIGKAMDYDRAMRIKDKAMQMCAMVGKILTVDNLQQILRIIELDECKFSKEQITEYMYRPKQSTLSDLRQYKDA